MGKVDDLDAANVFPLPLKIEDITAKWLTRALCVRHPHIEVAYASIENAIHGAGTVVRVRAEYDKAGQDAGLPPTLIVKGGFEPHSEMMQWTYALETRFYAEVQSRVTMNSPRCYFAARDPASYQSIIILEDLRARNVTWLHGSRPLGFDAMATLLRAIATYHAETWQSPHFAPGGAWDWLQGRFSDFFMQHYVETCFVEPHWSNHIELAQGAAVSVKLHDRDWARRVFLSLRDTERKGPVCLIHGDAHLGNLYLDADGTPGFLDQNTCKAHWATEVAYSIAGSLDVVDRRRWESALLSIYLETLASKGIDAPSYDEAFDAYARAVAYGYLVFVVNATQFQPSAVNTRGASRFGAAAIDHDSIGRFG